LVVLMAVQLSVAGLYLAPVLTDPVVPNPPQTIISLPVQTLVWPDRAVGALVVLVAVQVSSGQPNVEAGQLAATKHMIAKATKAVFLNGEHINL
jgi:hypothetical protein